MAILMMRRLVDKWSFSVFILFLFIHLLRILRRLGLRPKEDGWRNATRAFLRTEESKFILSSFGLNFFSGLDPDANLNARIECVIKRLAEFFKGQPEVRWQIKWDRISAKKRKWDAFDILHVDFDENGNLKSIFPYFDSSAPNLNFNHLGDKLKDAILQETINSYNRTKDLDDKSRPFFLSYLLQKKLLNQLAGLSKGLREEAKNYVERILSAALLSFVEVADLGDERFAPPSFVKRKHFGYGVLNIICRFSQGSDEVDLWVQCNHIAIDGVPMQEVLLSLKEGFAKGARVKFPAFKCETMPQRFSTRDGSDGVYNVSQIMDFTNLLKAKEELEGKGPGIPLTPLRLLIWRLGNHPRLMGTKFLVPVDLPAYNNYPRTLGFVIIRPSIFCDRDNPQRGLFAFLQEFARQLDGARARQSESYELLESYALLHPIFYSFTLKLMPSAVRELVGSMGITTIDKTDLFIGPFTDIHTDGFIAIGNYLVPTEDGKECCHVSVKGPKDKIEGYLAAIREVVGRGVN